MPDDSSREGDAEVRDARVRDPEGRDSEVRGPQVRDSEVRGPQVRDPQVRDPRIAAAVESYWRRNVRVMAALLAVWAFAGLGCGVLLADWLNRFRLGGFPLGFWFAQQGSILVFVLLILVYGLTLNRLDAEHRRELERIRGEPSEPRRG